MKARKLTLDDLTKPQQRALIDIVTQRGLKRYRAGYGEGRHVHALAVINALQRRELCTRHSYVDRELVVPTDAGWQLVKAALKDTNAKLGSFPAALR